MYKALFGTSSEVLQDRSPDSTDDFVILDEPESPLPQSPVLVEKATQSPAESRAEVNQGKRVSSDESLVAATPQGVSGPSREKDSQNHNAKPSEKATQTEQHALILKELKRLSSESSKRENLIASDEHPEELVSTLSLSEPARHSSDAPGITSVHRTLTQPSTISRRSLPKPVTPVVTVTSKALPKIFEACRASTTRAGSRECSEMRGKTSSGLLRPYGEERRERAGSEIGLSDVQTIESLEIDRLETSACEPRRIPRPLTTLTMSRIIREARKDTEIPESVNYREAIRDRAMRIAKEVSESERKARPRSSEPYFPPYQNEYYQDLCGLCHFPVPEYQPYTVELAGMFYHKRCVADHLFSKKELRAALRARCEEKSRKRAQPTRKCSLWQKVVKGFSNFFKAK